MSKFKVGDEVRLTSVADINQEGGFGVVVIEGDSSVHISFPDGQQWNVPDHYIELSEPKVHITSGGTIGVGCDSVTIYPNPPHIHKDLIIAWANGADIEVSSGDRVFYETSNPQWLDTLEYRIKPTKTSLQIEIEELEAKLIKLKGQL
jgi:hypothetical protein